MKPWKALLLMAGLILLDQGTKFLAAFYLKGTAGISLIPGCLRLFYLENSGAAFGLMENQQPFFYLVTIGTLGAFLYAYIKMPKGKKYLPLQICLVVFMSGAAGNFIDRVRLQYVVDFIYFELIDFPVFNVADICVTVSVFVFAVLVLFVYKEEDFKRENAENRK